MEYPCIKCKQEVRPRQHAISCDTCGQWQHRKCDTGIPVHVYQQAVKEAIEIVFKCDPCSMKLEPLPNLEDLLEQLGNIGKDSSDSEDDEDNCFNRDINSVRDNKVNDYSDVSDDEDDMFISGQMKLNVSSFINNNQTNDSSSESDSDDDDSNNDQVKLNATYLNHYIKNNQYSDISDDDDDNDSSSDSSDDDNGYDDDDNNKPFHTNLLNMSANPNIQSDSSSDSSDDDNGDNDDNNGDAADDVNNKPIPTNYMNQTVNHNVLSDSSSDSSDSDNDNGVNNKVLSINLMNMTANPKSQNDSSSDSSDDSDDDNDDNDKTGVSTTVKKPIKQLKVKFPISDSSDSDTTDSEDETYWKLPTPNGSPECPRFEVVEGASRAGTDVLIDEICFTYTKKSSKNGTWYCSNRKCSVSFKECNGEYRRRNYSYHCHERDYTRHIVIKVLKQAKEMARFDSVRTSREILKEAHGIVKERRFNFLLKPRHVENMIKTLNKFRKSIM